MREEQRTAEEIHALWEQARKAGLIIGNDSDIYVEVKGGRKITASHVSEIALAEEAAKNLNKLEPERQKRVTALLEERDMIYTLLAQALNSLLYEESE